jgi:hypothetical protein
MQHESDMELVAEYLRGLGLTCDSGNDFAEVYYVVDHDGAGTDYNLIGEMWLKGAKLEFYPATDDNGAQRAARPPEFIDLHAPDSLQKLGEVVIFWKKKMTDYYKWDG